VRSWLRLGDIEIVPSRDNYPMTKRRAVEIVAGLAVAATAGVFVIAGRKDLESVAAVTTAIVGVAGLGVAVWAALPSQPGGQTAVQISHTGSVTRTGNRSGTAVTGVDIAGGHPPTEVIIENSGDIEGGDDAVTGYRQR
jgi:hypothetical protein